VATFSTTSDEVQVPDPSVHPTISVELAGRLMGVGRSSAYIAASRGEIPIVRIGRLLRVPTARFLTDILGFERPTAQSEDVGR